MHTAGVFKLHGYILAVCSVRSKLTAECHLKCQYEVLSLI